MAIRIEKHIPPPKADRRGSKEHYPFSQLEVGHSFFAPHSEYDAKRVRGAAYNAAKRLERKFMTRQNQHGIRVWRVE